MVLDQEGTDYALAAKFLGSVVREMKEIPQSFVASEKEQLGPDGQHVRSSHVTESYKLQFSAGLNSQLKTKVAEHKAKQAFLAGGGRDPRLLAQWSQYQASAPPGQSDMAVDHVSPLTQIPYMKDILGIPNEMNFIQQLFTKVALPQLHAEIPDMDWMFPKLQLAPTQKLDLHELDFESHFFYAKRNEVDFLLPREYRYRATIDPYNLYADAAARALREGREAMCLLALSTLDSEGTLSDPTASTATQFPSADKNVGSELEGEFISYWKRTRLRIDSCVMNPQDFRNYETNYYNQGFRALPDIDNWGLVNLPGFKIPVRTALSPFCPRGRLYFFNKKYAFIGEGPQVTETWPEPGKNADAGAWRDYIDVTIFNTKRAGFKMALAGTTPGDEITTLTQARDLVKPPTDLLAKNQ